MEVIERTIKVLDILSTNKGRMRFSDIAAGMNLASPSTLTRLLKALCDAGALHKDANGWYCLNSKIGIWGNAASPRMSLKKMIRPELEQLNDAFKVSTIVFQYQDENMMLCVDKIADENSPSLQNPGALIPLNLGVIGSCFFSVADSDFMAHFGDIDGLDELLHQFKKDSDKYGYIYDYGRLFPDNHRVAVPLKYDGKVFAVLGAGFTPSRLREANFVEKLTVALKKSAVKIEKIIVKQNGDY